jgi:hypothetical protein
MKHRCWIVAQRCVSCRWPTPRRKEIKSPRGGCLGPARGVHPRSPPGLRILRTFPLNRRCEAMRLIPVAVALVALTSPALTQGITQSEAQSSPSSSHGPTTDVICREEISATLCNVVGSPSYGGFVSTNNSQGTVGYSAVPTPHSALWEFLARGRTMRLGHSHSRSVWLMPH